MNGRSAFAGDTGGLTPVIGIILVVAITVILAAVTAAFALGFSDETGDSAPNFVPQTSFDDTLEGDGQTLTVKHESGSKISADELTITVVDADTNMSNGASYVGSVFEDQVEGKFSAGNEIEINRTVFETDSGGSISGNEYLLLENATVRIVWERPDVEESFVIYECTVDFPECQESA